MFSLRLEGAYGHCVGYEGADDSRTIELFRTEGWVLDGVATPGSRSSFGVCIPVKEAELRSTGRCGKSSGVCSKTAVMNTIAVRP